MALQGTLGHLGLADVLQNGLAGAHEGNLVVRRGADRAVFRLAGGGISLLEPDTLEPEDAIEAFVARGMLDPAAVAELRKEVPQSGVLLDRLVESGLLPEDALLDLLSATAEDAILDVLTWQDGTFRFAEGAVAPTRQTLLSRVSLDPGSLLLRAAQRMDERHAISAALGPRALLFLAIGDQVPEAREADDCVPAVFGLLDGRTTVDEIGHRLGVGRFAVLKAVVEMLEAGRARPATVGEIAQEVDARVQATKLGTARALVFQWADTEPENPAPIQKLAAIAALRQMPEEEADALVQLSGILLDAGKAGEAVEACRQAAARRPGDPDVLAAMRTAARAGGEARLYREITLELAQASLDADDAERCGSLLAELDPVDYGDLGARLLRAKALVRMKDRIALIAEVEAIVKLLTSGAKRKLEREAAVFCRDAVAVLAPERTDLLKKLQALCEGKSARPRRVALVGALVAVLASAGFLLWPVSAAGLLDQVREAVASGDRAAMSDLVAKLVEDHPDSEEAQEALRLQAAAEEARRRSVVPPVDAKTRKQVEDDLPKWVGGLRGLPADPAKQTLATIVDLINGPEGAGLRPAVMQRVHPALVQSLQALVRSVRTRTDALAGLRVQAQSHQPKADLVRALVEETSAYLTDGYADRVAEVRELVHELDGGDPQDPYALSLRELDQALKQLRSALKAYAKDYDACRRIVAGLDLEEDYRACREEAPKMLVAGRLDDADECYARLEERLDRYAKEPVLSAVVESAAKRQIPQFLRDRRGQIAEIRRGMDAAAAAEGAGDLLAASRIYGELAKRFWFIRFENVFTVPMRVETVPSGVRVAVNGRDAGPSPVTIRYAWGSQTTVTVEAPGYAPVTEVVGTADAVPVAHLTVRLLPRARWTAGVASTVATRAVPLGDDVLVGDRTGRVTLWDGSTGDVIWAKQLSSLEGVRSRPVAAGNLIAVSHVDGRLTFLSPKDGTVLDEVEVGRPVGDPAVWGDTVATVTQDRRLVTFVGRKRTGEVALSADPSAGVLAAHGAFWVGTAEGGVDRVDAGTRARRALPLAEASAPVVGLAGTSLGVLVTTGDGTLYALDPTGKPLWHSSDLGDLVGTPAGVAGVAACVDRQGRVLLFDAHTGQPRGQEEARGEPIGGLLAVEPYLVAATVGGRVWAYDGTTGEVAVDASVGADTPEVPPGDLGHSRVALPAKGSRLQVVDLALLRTPPAPSSGDR